MPAYIDAYGFILLRVGGSVLCFGWFGFFMPKRKLLTDFPRIIAAAFFGVAFNMLTFSRIKPDFSISAAVIMVSTPMIV
jgi:hypothetical protein